MTRLFTRVKNFFRKSDVDRALDAELSSHLQLHIDDNLAKGMSPEAARKDALLKLGGLEQTKESMRDQQSLPVLESLLADARFALRLLKKSPAFTCVAILTLALGIGANTAIFSVMRQVLLQRLPLPHAEQLVLLYSPGAHEGHTSSDESDGSESFSYPMYVNLRDQNVAFSGLVAKADFPISLAFRGATDRAGAELVSGNYFSVLGVNPAIGRLIEPVDATAPGSSPVVVLAYPYWQKHFGGDPYILNQTLQINSQPMTVVGVAPSGFTGIQPGQVSDVYLPITMKPVVTPSEITGPRRGLTSHLDYWVKIMGRLRPGTTMEQATAALAPTYHALLVEEGPLNTGLSPEEKKEFLDRKIIMKDGSRGRPMLANGSRSQLLTLMGMVALVLCITCANVAGLLTARGTARQKEIGIRLSLGASRGRLICQLLLESCVLSLAGAVLGLLFARWLSAVIVHYASANQIADGLSASLNTPVLAFTVGIGLFCGIFFGVAPAWSSTRVDVAPTLKEQAGSISSAVSHARFRKFLVVGQFALTLLLVVSAWGFVRSLYNLKNRDLGFRADHVLQFSVAPALNGYDQGRAFAFFADLEQRLAALPGVQSLSSVEEPLIGNSSTSTDITVESVQGTTDVTFNPVGPNHFSNLQVPLLQGREFTVADNATSPKVVIVNEAFVQKYFPNGQAVGKRIKFGGGPGPLDTAIVGVVKNSNNAEVKEEHKPFVYLPYRQRERITSLTFYLRTSSDPSALAGSVRSAIARVDSSMPIFDVRSFEEQIGRNISTGRLLAILALAFGSLAAILAAMGVYALLAYTVSQRNREIGVRMALGAEPGSVALMILSDVGVLSGFGVVIGVPLAYAASKFLNSMLYNVQSFGLVSLSISLLILGSVAALAAWLPARRAARIDPIIALRYE